MSTMIMLTDPFSKVTHTSSLLMLVSQVQQRIRYQIVHRQDRGTRGYLNQRQVTVTDPNSFTSTTTQSVVCGVSGTSDTGCYMQSVVVDAQSQKMLR